MDAKGYVLDRFEIVNGYAKNAKTWRANAVASKIRYRVCCAKDGKWKEWTEASLQAPVELPASGKLYQSVQIAEKTPVSYMELDVSASMKPSPAAKDVCISEIRFFVKEDPRPDGLVCRNEFSSRWGFNHERNKSDGHDSFHWIDFDECKFSGEFEIGDSEFKGGCQKKGNGIQFTGEVIQSSASGIQPAKETIQNSLPKHEKFSTLINLKQIDRYTALIGDSYFFREVTENCRRPR